MRVWNHERNRFDEVTNCWDGKELLPDRPEHQDLRMAAKEHYGWGTLISQKESREIPDLSPFSRSWPETTVLAKCACGRRMRLGHKVCQVCRDAKRRLGRHKEVVREGTT
jgi:hypothetical protein